MFPYEQTKRQGRSRSSFRSFTVAEIDLESIPATQSLTVFEGLCKISFMFPYSRSQFLTNFQIY